jgi:hypothetical protein
VNNFFDGTKTDCRDCINHANFSCDVVDQSESPWQCPALRDHVRYESINLYGRALALRERCEESAKQK